MNDILALGLFLFCGIFLGYLVGKINLPAVTGYLIAGLILGVSLLDVVPDEIIKEISFIENVALGFIAFNIGESFNIDKIKQLGGGIIVITIVQAFVTIVCVTIGATLVTKNLAVGIIFGALSAATAPAATINVIKQYKAKGKLTNTILTVVALDDAVCLFLFSIACSISEALLSGSFSFMSAFIKPLLEILESLAIGGILGFGFSYIAKKVRNSENLLLMSCAVILLGSGLGFLFDLSSILVCMASGSVIANFYARHNKVFSIAEGAINPVYVIFFVMAGYSLDIKVVLSLGMLEVAFVISRFIGKMLGAYLGCSLAKTDSVTKTYLGTGLMPMAGVGVGLAVAAGRILPDYQQLFINIIMGATFFFEIIGPILTSIGLKKSGDIVTNK